MTEETDNQERAWSLGTSVYLLVLLAIVLAGHAIHRRRFKFATEGSVSLLAGLLAGCVIYGFNAVRHGKPVPAEFVQFDNRLFFQVLLPPIIFYAGFSVKKKLFFQNFLTIFLFGVVGTFITAAIISSGAQSLLTTLFDATSSQMQRISTPLGIIFACTDSVATLQVLNQDETPVLYSLVFGEGVVNDASAIVLLGAVSHLSTGSHGSPLPWSPQVLLSFLYLFVGSLALGVGFGLASALLVRHAFAQHHSMDREVLLVGLTGISTYMLADGLGLSAIFAVFFCGITISHYTLYSLSAEAQEVTQHAFRIVAAMCEIVLFSYAGLDMWFTALWRSDVYTSSESAGKVVGLAFTLLGLVMASRAAFIFPAACFANMWRRQHRMSLKDMVLIWWAGLPRGAITLALAYHQFYHSSNPEPKNQIIIAASVLVVLVTTVGFGACTQGVLDLLLWRWAHGHHHALGGVEVPLLATHGTGEGTTEVLYPRPPITQPLARLVESTNLHAAWRWFDDHIMQPVFGGSSAGRHEDQSPDITVAAHINPPPADLQIEAPVSPRSASQMRRKSTGQAPLWADA